MSRNMAERSDGPLEMPPVRTGEGGVRYVRPSDIFESASGQRQIRRIAASDVIHKSDVRRTEILKDRNKSV